VTTTVAATTTTRPTSAATVPIPLLDPLEELKIVPIVKEVFSRYLKEILS
jgi:hypothetical protein